MFINHDYINNLLEKFKNPSLALIEQTLNKASEMKGLSHEDIAILLQAHEQEHLQKIFKLSGDIKNDIYGNRVVIFAPLYISNYCINNCTYCGYKKCNSFTRHKLSMEEIQDEVRILESLGHKRLALEIGEDPINCPIDYVLESIKAIYDTKTKGSSIRRVNVNIAATTTENYKKLKQANIGTYILFQETYHKPTYEKVHPKSLKGNYDYHLLAFDRAMEAGIDDVGGGVLFGLYDYKFEILALMLHNEHLESNYGVGFHTISVPRLKKAEGMNLTDFPHIIDDNTFKKVVSIIRLAVPFTGIILSTRETEETRKELLNYGVSQISAGSCTGVGGYREKENNVPQFSLGDERSPLEILKWLLNDGFIPSYCTACYRQGRTGDRFMNLAKSGQIHNVCTPNALLTLAEYALDFGDDELSSLTMKSINRELEKIERDDIKSFILAGLDKLKNNERDIYI